MANKPKKQIAQFHQWIPGDYLEDFYTHVQQDEKATIAFLVDIFRHVKDSPVMIEFGTGPTLHHVFAAAPYVSEIHMADYLTRNLAEVKKWVDNHESAHRWDEFVEYTLQCEGLQNPTKKDVSDRIALTRSKITSYIQVDANKPDPAGGRYREKYPLVMSCYCADSATTSKEQWRTFMINIMSLIAPNGGFITTALRNAPHYKVGHQYFPSAKVNEDDFQEVLGLDFSRTDTTIKVVHLDEHEDQGYDSILLACAWHKQ